MVVSNVGGESEYVRSKSGIRKTALNVYIKVKR